MSISAAMRPAGVPNPTPPAYDNDQLSSEALTETVSRARALGIPVDLLDSARPTLRAELTDAINDAWQRERALSYAKGDLSDARAEQGAWWPVIPGTAGGVLVGALAGAGTYSLAMRVMPERAATILGGAIGLAGIVGTALGVRALVNHDTDVEVRELTQLVEHRTTLRDDALDDALAIAGG